MAQTEKQKAKLEAKREKAEAKKAELAEKIADLKDQIKDETDEKKKAQLRKQRDEIIAQRDGISRSKDGMTIPMAKNTKRAITSCISIVLIIALLCAYVATGAVRHGFVSYFGLPQSTFTGMTLTDADGEKHDIKVATYNYYFAMQYNKIRSTQSTYQQYGLDLGESGVNVDFDKKFSEQTTKNDDGDEVTWAEYMQEEVTESIKKTYTYYYAAVKENGGKAPAIEDDQKTELKDTLKEYTEEANKYGFTLSGYLTAAMGKGVNEELFKKEAKISYIAQNYEEKLKDDFSSKEYTDKDYNDYKKEHADELISVDVKIFECDSEDDAKNFKKALNADGSNFADLCVKYTENKFDASLYKDAKQSIYRDITKSTLQNQGYAIATPETSEGEKEATDSYPGLDWLFSKKRATGDVKQFSTTVVYVIKPAHYPTTKTVNVRHILVTPYFNAKEDAKGEDKEAKDATKEQWDAAYKQAKKILAEYKKGDKTADSFGALAKKNSEDGNASEGGVYKNVYPNQMVPTFDAWCFDSARKAGDTAIVKTQFGYHVMYFESKGDLNAWQYTAQQALASDDTNAKTKELEDKSKIDINWFGSRYFQKDTDIDS